ncbi:hypothetical protein [Pseudocnuella soli]|uniref:hypothetical protein n=1 Tax=Pseudocnuella soli TaxID=2502779 RepID=UPI001042C688|nr:hypothetical protein [Pseudocnuella soli]
MESEQFFTSLIFLTVCYLLILLLAFIVCVSLIRSVLKKSARNRKEKIISIGITSLLFSNTINAAVLYPLTKVIVNLQSLFYLFNSYANGQIQRTQASGEKISEMPFSDGAFSFSDVVQSYPLSKIFVAFAFCVIIYYGILYLKSSLAGETVIKPAGASFFLYNSAIVLLLAFSLFLVISVFITIPYLNEMRKPSVFTQARLDSALSKISFNDSFNVVGIGPSPFEKKVVVDSILKDPERKAYQGLPDNVKSSVLNLIEIINNENERQNQFRTAAVEKLRSYTKLFRDKQSSFKQGLLLNFERSSQSITADKGTLLQLSVAAYDDFVQTGKFRFNNVLEGIRNSDRYNFSERERITDDIQRKIALLSEGPRNDSLLYSASYLSNPNESLPRFDPYTEVNTDSYYSFYVEGHENDGSNWGIFGSISKFLIKPKSSELVLLIGMLGFGLLGASILSFEKNEGEGSLMGSFMRKPIIRNFEIVLARGFGAALVIYLATKGGLAIFAAGADTDANGYVLLLTCFVGAVYSDKVWEKINSYLHGSK